MSARRPRDLAATAESAAAPSLGRFAEGDNINNINSGQPNSRNLCFSIRATLAELAASKRRSVISPPATIFQTQQFTDLGGSSEAKGDLASTILHSVSAVNVKSTFPLTVGVDLTGVDAKTYSSTGRAFSTIVMPNFESHTPRELQKDDPAVAYAFAEKYPSYNAHNLETNGVHRVPSKNFVLVACDHPIMTAITDNQGQLQNTEMQQMDEGFVKMSSTLYNAVLPVVKQQVASQVVVRDFSSVNFQIAPAEHSSWAACLEAETVDACRALKAERSRALSAIRADLGSDEKAKKVAEINADFDSLENQKVAALQHSVLTLSADIQYTYNHLVATPSEASGSAGDQS